MKEKQKYNLAPRDKGKGNIYGKKFKSSEKNKRFHYLRNE